MKFEKLKPGMVVVRLITKDDLPLGPHWDEDGACFTAITSDPATTGCEWRWAPNNTKAFAKGGPDKPLLAFCPPSSALRRSTPT